MKHVAVIGAGPAGLTAAHDLLCRASHEYIVTVFESTDATGGIAQTLCHNGNRMDIGGHRFFSKDQKIMDWWKARMPLQGAPASDDLQLHRTRTFLAGGPDPEKEDCVMLLRNRVSRIFFAKKFFDYPLQIKPAVFFNLGLWRTLRAGFSYCHALACKRPERTLEDFFINRFGYELYSIFFESYTQKVWGLHPSQLSADWGVQRVRGISIWELVLDGVKKMLGLKKAAQTATSLIEEFWYPKLGPGQLWESVASEIEDMGGHIVKNHPVTHIQCQDGKVQAITCATPSGEKIFPADIVLSSMPIKDLVQALQCPEEICRIAAGLPYRDFITVGVLASKLKIQNTTKIRTVGNIVPDCWIYIQEKDVKVGRLQIFNNWSPYLVAEPDKTVWIGMEYFCNEGDALWNLESEAMQNLAVQELQKMGIADSADVLNTCCTKIRKAYPAYFGTYDQIDKIRAWLDTRDGLYCIGRNGQHRYNNMDHSMLTSFFAVDHILGKAVCKKDIWKINAEQEYNETK